MRMQGFGLAMIVACLAMPGAGQSASPDAASSNMAPRPVVIGDPLRKALLDSLRLVAEEDLGQPLLFVVDGLRVQGHWAFAVVHPRTPAGAAIDFRMTRHAGRLEDGVLDGDIIYALLQRTGRLWTVADYAIGPTDVAYAAWPAEYGAPPALMGLPRQAGDMADLNGRKSARAR